MITIEAVKNALSLRVYLAEHGAEFVRDKARCPFHDDKTPSASLYRGRDGYERLKCFGCGKDVDLIGAAQELHNLDFKGALRVLADRAGIKTAQTTAERQAAEKAREEQERKAEAVRAFRRWEQETANDIAEVLRRYRYYQSTYKGPFTESELQELARLQTQVDYLEYIYEDVLCKKDDLPKYELFKEDMGYAK